MNGHGQGMLHHAEENLAAAEAQFDLLVPTDQNLPYQQNLSSRNLAILVLPTTSWSEIQQHIAEIITAISSLTPGGYFQVRW